MYRILCSLYFAAIIVLATNTISTSTVKAEAIKWEDDKPKVKIKASGHFRRQLNPKQLNSKLAPPGTTANILAVDKYRFSWKPRWNFVGMGGALLPFVRHSLDQSVLGIIETLPQKDAPDSSIIVFINLYNLEIINYVVLPGRNVRAFCYIPDSRKIACLVKHPFNKYYPTPEYQFLIIDTRTTETASASPVFKKNITAFCCSSDGNRLFAAVENSDKLRIYTIDDLKREFETLKTVKTPIAVNQSLDGRRLVVTGGGEIQIFDASTDEVILEKSIKLPEHYYPDKTILCAKDASTLLVSRIGDNTYYYNNGNFINLRQRTDADVAWWEAGKRIIAGNPKKSQILVYSPSNLESPESDFYLRRSRPKTTGKLRKIVCLPDKKMEIVILDTMGALIRFTKKKRRWQKEIIIDQPSPQ
jgi:hypothetical protein